MKAAAVLVASAMFVMLTLSAVSAQTPGGPHDHPSGPAEGSAAPPAPGPGVRGGGMPMGGMPMGGMPMMDMCRQMTGGMMSMPMMGGGPPADPKERAAMLEMRGEMMKAMGEIMLKHARRIQGAPAN